MVVGGCLGGRPRGGVLHAGSVVPLLARGFGRRFCAWGVCCTLEACALFLAPYAGWGGGASTAGGAFVGEVGRACREGFDAAHGAADVGFLADGDVGVGGHGELMNYEGPLKGRFNGGLTGGRWRCPGV